MRAVWCLVLCALFGVKDSYEADPPPSSPKLTFEKLVLGDAKGKISEKLVNRGTYINRPGWYKSSSLDTGVSATTDPFAGRVGPTSASMNPTSATPYVITSTRLKEIRSQFLYWFFDQGGDGGVGDLQTNINPSSPQIHKNLNFQLPFFGFRFNYTRVSLNGYLEFSDPPEQLNYPLKFPIVDWPKKNDPSFIGIFYSRCRIGSLRENDEDLRAPGVYFRLERDLWGRTDRFGVEMRERLTWDLREGVIGADSFVPKHAAIITWKNVTFAGGIEASMTKTNTFQMVLATNEVITYAIFNYALITWTSHTEAGGDTTGGEGGVPAYIGFNAGNGTRSYEYMPFSQQSTVRDLTNRGMANGFPGRHIFRIDENILNGVCNKDIAGASLPLTFAPESGNMLGGTIVNITGPCFTPDMELVCRFDYTPVLGIIVDTNRAVCVQPYILAEGYIPFEIQINGGDYIWKGKYYVETPATAEEKIIFTDDSVHQKYPNEIKFLWNKQNLTSNSAASVQISLWGYRETTKVPELVYIDLLDSGVANSGSYSISPSSYKLRDNPGALNLAFGFIQINLTNPSTTQTRTVNPVIWSRPIPIGWYLAPQWEKYNGGSKWPEKKCDEWLINDRYLKNFAADLSMCPCKLEQALADKGRFLPDFNCDMVSNPNCFYHKGAKHCVKTGAPNMEGSEQQCCYDKNNYLMLSYDQQWGSTPKRSSNLGYLPWNEANKVPTLSQWYNDISPFYHCCYWQFEQAIGCETFRYERRPSQDCVGYQGPSVGTVFGDPHFVTFDDLEYTFNGKGEFVLVRADSGECKLDVQGRFEQVPRNIYGEVGATMLTSVAAKGNDSAVVEVRLRPFQARWRYHLDVFVDSKRVYFDRPAYRVQHFRGVTVYQPSKIIDQSQIIIMFDSGAGVEVLESRGYMATRVYLPWTFINQTRGLLGNWSFDQSNDFTLPNGNVVSISNLNDLQTIHTSFAINWLLEDRADPLKGEALFVNEYGRTASYYANRSFVPIWNVTPQTIIPLNRSRDIQMAETLCGDCYQCKFDYAVSLNRDMAYHTLMYYSTFTQTKQLSRQRTISCGVLETPQFGRKSNFFFVPDTKVIFECNQGYILIGDKRRACTSIGKWTIPESGFSQCLPYEEYDLRQLLKTTLIIIAILLPLLLVLVCIGSYTVRRLNKDKSSGQQSWEFKENQDPHGSLPLLLKRRRSQIETDPKSNVSKYENSDTQKSSSDEMNRAGRKKVWNNNFEKEYDTGEPLPGRPLVDFDDEDNQMSDETLPVESPSPPSSSEPVREPLNRNRSVETDIF